MSLNEFNYSLIQNLLKFLPRETKGCLKQVNKKFNNAIDLSDDYEQWKSDQIKNKFGGDRLKVVYVEVHGNDALVESHNMRFYLNGIDFNDIPTYTKICDLSIIGTVDNLGCESFYYDRFMKEEMNRTKIHVGAIVYKDGIRKMVSYMINPRYLL